MTVERADAFAVTIDRDMALREGTWDGDRARREMFEWATEGDETDLAKAARGFTVADLDLGTRAGLKLPVAYVEDGELVGVGNGIRAALSRLPQTEGLPDAVRAEAERALTEMLDRLNEQTADAAAQLFGLDVKQAKAFAADACSARRRLADVERSEDERARIREEFPEFITMTPSQMEAWSESQFAGENRKEGEAAASAREALRDVMRLKERPMSEWTEGDYDDAVEAIAFVKRMSKVEQGDPITIEGREGPSERDAALRDWGHWTDAAKADAAKADARPPRKTRHRLLATALSAASVVGLAQATADDGRVHRWSRVAMHLDARQVDAVDRAIAEAERAEGRCDADTIKAVAAGLRADGFDDYLTDEGFLLLEVNAARTGTQYYSDGAETWGEYRSDEEVEASLPTWALKPFVDDHSPGLVTPESYTAYTKGACGQDASLTDPLEDGLRYVRLTVLVGDLATLRKIREGKVELSAGYTTIPVEDPGTDPQGNAYRYRQTLIRINHLALVDAGRAGPLARIRVDGGAWEIPKKDDSMKLDKDKLMLLLPEMMGGAHRMGGMLREAEDASPEAIAAVAEMLAKLAEAAMAGEEMPEDAMSRLSDMSEMDPAALADMCKPGHDAEHAEMMEVEIADGLTVKLTADEAKEWARIDTEIKRREDEASRSDADLRTQIEALRSRNDKLESRVSEVEAHADAAAREALLHRVDSLCPDMTKRWRPDKESPIAEGKSLLDMKLDAIADLDPEAKADVEGAREDFEGKAFERYVDRTLTRVLADATGRRGDGKPSPAPAPRTDLNSLIEAQVYS